MAVTVIIQPELCTCYKVRENKQIQPSYSIIQSKLIDNLLKKW